MSENYHQLVMSENYHKEIEATLIQKYLQEVSFIVGESVVMRGVRLWLASHDKIAVPITDFLTSKSE